MVTQMKGGLIQQELKRLARVKAYTPNIHSKWQQEEDERAFIAWCRKPEPILLADEVWPEKKDWTKAFRDFIHSIIP